MRREELKSTLINRLSHTKPDYAWVISEPLSPLVVAYRPRTDSLHMYFVWTKDNHQNARESDEYFALLRRDSPFNADAKGVYVTPTSVRRMR